MPPENPRTHIPYGTMCAQCRACDNPQSVHDAQCEGEKGVLARVMSSQRPHLTPLASWKGLFPCGGGRSHALE